LHTTTFEVYSRLWTVHEVDEGLRQGIRMKGLCDFGKFTAKETSSSMMINTCQAQCQDEDRSMLVKKVKDCGGFDRLDTVIRGFRAKMKQEFQQGCDIFQKLSTVPLMKRLHDSQHVYVSAICKERDFMTGDVLIEQGVCHDAFYMILDGEANCMTCDKFLFKISSGDWIGELSILNGERSTVRIQACRPTSTLMISKNDFQGMQLHKRLQLPEAPMPRPPSPKFDTERFLFIQAVKQNENLNYFANVTDLQAKQLCDMAWEEELAAGDCLIKQSSFRGLYFFVVKEGIFEATDSAGCLVKEFHVGASFGEFSLLYNKPPSADVVARSNSRVWLIDRRSFKTIIFGGSSQEEASPRKLMHHSNREAQSLSDCQEGPATEGLLDIFSLCSTKDGYMPRRIFEVMLCELSQSLFNKLAVTQILQRFTDDEDDVDVKAFISWLFS